MKIKSLIGIALVVGIMASFVALQTGNVNAFIYGANDNGGTTSLSTTNIVAATSTNTTAGAGGIGVAVDVSGYDNVGLQVSGTNSTASVGTVFFTLLRSLDGVNFETAADSRLSFTCTFAAGASTLVYTNLMRELIGSAGYVKVGTLNNSGSGIVGGNTTNAAGTFGIIIAAKRLAAPR